MKRRASLILAGALALCAAGGVGSVPAAAVQGSLQASAAQLRATGLAGEQANGYLGIVSGASAGLQASVNSVNIRRRAAYTALAMKRRVQIEEVAATMACEILANSVLPGQYYKLPDGIWRRREGNAPIPRPLYCV